jgi:hypothetical protein
MGIIKQYCYEYELTRNPGLMVEMRLLMRLPHVLLFFHLDLLSWTPISFPLPQSEGGETERRP